VSDAYRHFARHPKAQRNPNWRAKVRQKLQQCGNRIGRNEYVEIVTGTTSMVNITAKMGQHMKVLMGRRNGI
jgi:hypothetical protein